MPQYSQSDFQEISTFIFCKFNFFPIHTYNSSTSYRKYVIQHFKKKILIFFSYILPFFQRQFIVQAMSHTPFILSQCGGRFKKAKDLLIISYLLTYTRRKTKRWKKMKLVLYKKNVRDIRIRLNNTQCDFSLLLLNRLPETTVIHVKWS